MNTTNLDDISQKLGLPVEKIIVLLPDNNNKKQSPQNRKLCSMAQCGANIVSTIFIDVYCLSISLVKMLLQYMSTQLYTLNRFLDEAFKVCHFCN